MKYYQRTTKKQLGELLIEQGAITREQLHVAIEQQKQTPGLIGGILVQMNFVTEQDIAKALTCQYGFPYLPLSNYEISQETIEGIPQRLCEQHCLIPIDKIGKSLTLAMANPLDLQAIEDVEAITECSVQIFVSTPADIRQSIEKYYAS